MGPERTNVPRGTPTLRRQPRHRGAAGDLHFGSMRMLRLASRSTRKSRGTNRGGSPACFFFRGGTASLRLRNRADVMPVMYIVSRVPVPGPTTRSAKTRRQQMALGGHHHSYSAPSHSGGGRLCRIVCTGLAESGTPVRAETNRSGDGARCRYAPDSAKPHARYPWGAFPRQRPECPLLERDGPTRIVDAAKAPRPASGAAILQWQPRLARQLSRRRRELR